MNTYSFTHSTPEKQNLTQTEYLVSGRMMTPLVKDPFHYNASLRNAKLTNLRKTNKISAKIYFHMLTIIFLEIYLLYRLNPILQEYLLPDR